jgi:predicted kinase
MEMPATSLADDLLEGADAIATYVYGDPKHRRKVYHLAATRGIPTFNLGALVCARKSTLIEWIKAQEARA